MELRLPENLRSEFALRAEWRKEDERDRERAYLDAAKRKKDEIAEEKREEKEDRELIEAIATSAQIESFSVKLDRYDTATVQALMDNQKALERVQERLREMRKEAYVLPDGRRVFKTEDGKRVFDEQGTEVHELDPHAIDDRKPRWEKFRDGLDLDKALTNERKQILEYQEELDDARELSHRKGVTKHDLDEEEERIRRDAPDRVRQLMKHEEQGPGNDRRDEPHPASFKPAGKLDMPSIG